MRVWIITVGEPLPTDGDAVRLYRTGILANLMSGRGHDVTWWTASFNHMERRQRTEQEQRTKLRDNYQLVRVFAPSYRKSVGVRRLWSHAVCAFGFARAANSAIAPDIILASYPTIELSLAAVAYGEKHNVPVVLDIRDLWPDIFVEAFPRFFRPFSRFLLFPYELMARIALRRANSIVGVTEEFVEWGYAKASRPADSSLNAFAMGYERAEMTDEELSKSEAFWKGHGLDQADWIACFFGTLGRQFELKTIIDAARLLDERIPAIKFVICGDGDNAAMYRSLANGLGNVIFPGWVDKNQIRSLMRMSKIGLAPYAPSPNFLLNIANKPIEYLSEGLPLFSTIDGALGRLIKERGVGIVCSRNCAQGIADALERLWRDPATLEKMSLACKQLFEERYLAQNIYSNFSDFLEEIASRR